MEHQLISKRSEGYRLAFAGHGQSLARDFANYRGDPLVEAWLLGYSEGLRDWLNGRKPRFED